MSATSPLGYLLGVDVLVVGVEPDPTEVDDNGDPLTRCYIEARYLHKYVLVGGDDARSLDRAWGSSQHLVIKRPPADAIYVDLPEEAKP